MTKDSYLDQLATVSVSHQHLFNSITHVQTTEKQYISYITAPGMTKSDDSDDSGYSSAHSPCRSASSCSDDSESSPASSRYSTDSLAILDPKPIPPGETDDAVNLYLQPDSINTSDDSHTFPDSNRDSNEAGVRDTRGTASTRIKSHVWHPVGMGHIPGVKETNYVPTVDDRPPYIYSADPTPPGPSGFSRTASAISTWWNTHALSGTEASACSERFSRISSSFRSLDTARQLSYLGIGAMTVAAGAAGASAAYGLTTDTLSNVLSERMLGCMGGTAAAVVSGVAGTAAAAVGGMFGKGLRRALGGGTGGVGSGWTSSAGSTSMDGTIPGD